jgi:hypothetical protein
MVSSLLNLKVTGALTRERNPARSRLAPLSHLGVETGSRWPGCLACSRLCPDFTFTSLAHNI